MKKRADKHRFIKAWKSSPETLTFMRSLCKGRVLNICAGESLIGDVNVDIEPRYPDVVQGDVLDENFDLGEQFDTVISDPPWNWGYDTRHKFAKFIVKHLKVGGRLVLYAPWLPNQVFEPEDIYIPWTKGGFPKNVSPISVSIKQEPKGYYRHRKPKPPKVTADQQKLG